MKPSDVEYLYNKLDIGILIVDAELTVLFMNDWIRYRLPSNMKNIQNLLALFDRNEKVAIHSIVKKVIDNGVPFVLSQAIHHWIIPLPDKRFNNKRMRQSGIVTPISYNGQTSALIQIRDESDTVLRIRNLRQIQDRLSEKTKQLELSNIQLQKNEAELKKAKERAETANKAKNEFLASMSHELRTPLNVVNGFAQLLKMSDNITEEQRDQLDMIEQSGNTLLTLINHVLELVKLESGSDLLELSTVYLKSFLKEISQLVEAKTRKKGIQYVPLFDRRLPDAIKTDIHKLHCALMAIIDNAIKFTKDGSVTFEVKPVNGRIRFEIRDTGVGIPQDKIEKIFIPFPPRDSYRSEEGAGLGLAVSSKLIEILGGKLKVRSSPGKGTEFSFEIEVVESDEGIYEFETKNIKGYEGPQRTILVAEDELFSRVMITKILELFGFKIIEAENGQECVEKTLQYKPDLIFMDVHMPNMNGLEATSMLKKNSETASIPIVAMSGSIDSKVIDECKQTGFDDILFKPFNSLNLLAQCHKYLKLNWIIEEGARLPFIFHDTDSITQTDIKKLEYPPPDQCQLLIKLAQMGDIREMRNVVNRIEKMDLIYQPFVTVMRKYLKTYDMKEIIHLLELSKNECSAMHIGC